MALSAPDIAITWDNDNHKSHSGVKFNDLHKRITYLEHVHFSQYLPTVGSTYHDFATRFEAWLECVASDDDKRALFEFAPEITFITREDFAQLYRCALSGPISRWTLDQLSLRLQDPTSEERLRNAIHKTTWYCPLSDSMAIADFHHANSIGGIPYRPDWRSLAAFAEKSRVQSFMTAHTVEGVPSPLERVVVLEDFIGAGWQLLEGVREEVGPGGTPSFIDAVEFAGSFAPIEFLFVPLIICPLGAEQLRQRVRAFTNVKCEPVLELSDAEFINDAGKTTLVGLYDKIRQLAHSTYPQVVGDGSAHPRPYGEFGNNALGAKIVMYSNAPAGTLPLIQHSSSTWQPPFPRSARVR